MTRVFLLLALLVPVALAQRAPQSAASDVAVERYHAGAQAFVNGDMARAKAAVDAGLRTAPANARLQALRDLIEQEQEQQDQQQGGQNSDQAQNESDGEEGQPGDQGESGQDQPPPPDEPEAEQDQTRTQPQDPGQEQNGDDSQTGRQGDGRGGDEDVPAAAEAGEMSQAQAERILDAVGGEERLLLRELRRTPTRSRQSDKDW